MTNTKNRDNVNYFDVEKAKELDLLGKIKVYYYGVEIKEACECFCGKDGYVVFAPLPIQVIDEQVVLVTIYGNVTVKIDE